jgi:hypothetical protein
MITELLRRVAHSWGRKDGSVGGLWLALLSAATPNRTGRATVVPVGSDAARMHLSLVLQQLDGSQSLIVALAEGHIPPLVAHVMERRPLTEADLTRLRVGLDVAPRHR